MEQPLWNTVWRFLKKSKIEIPYDPVFPILGIYPKRGETLSGKDRGIPMFIAALFIIAKVHKQSKRLLVAAYGTGWGTTYSTMR